MKPVTTQAKSRPTLPLGMAVYEHAAALIGESPWAVSRNEDLIVRAHGRAYETYRHKPVIVGIDIYNLEAEALGAMVSQPTGNGIPAITAPPFAHLDDLLALKGFDGEAGRLDMVIRAGRRLAKDHPGADVRIPVAGPFSIASNLLPLENLLCELLADPDKARAALARLADIQVEFCREIRRAGLDIALFESAATPPMLSPAQFRQIELPVLKDLLVRAAGIVGHPLPCIIGGDTTPILEAILSTGTGYVVCPAETDQDAFMAIVRDRTEITVRVNMDSVVLSRGKWDEIRSELDRISALIAGRANSCVGTGAVPYETSPQTLLRIKAWLEGDGTAAARTGGKS